MAFDAQQIYPIDFNNSAAVGINLPLQFPTAFQSNFTTSDAIKNNLINYFLTEPGDIPLNPSFGGGLRSFIFSQITDNNLDGLKERIQKQVSQYFTNISVDDLNVFQQNDSNSISIELKYRVTNTNITGNLELDFT